MKAPEKRKESSIPTIHFSGVNLLLYSFREGIYITLFPGSARQNKEWYLVFRIIHVTDSLLPVGKVWSLDFLGYTIFYHKYQPNVGKYTVRPKDAMGITM